MAIAIIFLIMFVFALLSSGASQISAHQEKAEAQKFLLGQIPESDVTKTAEEMDQAAKDLQDMASKRQILQVSLGELAKMAASIENREDSIKKLFERQNKNQALIQKSQQIIAEKEQELDTRTKEVASTQFRARSLESDIEQKQKLLASLQAKLNETQELAQQKQSALDETRKAIAEKDQQINASSANIAQLQKTLENRTGESDKTRKTLESTLASEQKKSQGLSDTLTALQAEAQAATKTIAEQNKTILSQQNEMQKQSLALEGKVKQVEAQLQGSAKQLEAAKEGADEQRKALAKLQAELQEVKGQNAALTKTNQGLGDKNAHLSAANDKLGEAIKQGQGENEGLKGTLKQLGAKLAGLEGEVKGLGNENGKLKAANGLLGDSLKRGQGENAALKGELGGLGDKVAGLEGHLQGLGKENGNLKQAIADKNSELQKFGKEKEVNAKLLADLDDADKTKADLKKKLDETAKKLADEKDKAGTIKQINDTLGKDLDKTKADLDRLADQNRKAEKDIADSKKTNEQLDKSLAALQTDKNRLQQEAGVLGNELKDLMQHNQDLGRKLNQADQVQIACETEKVNARDEQKKLANNVKANEKKLGEVAATLKDARKAVQDIDNERKRIASSIATNLKASGVEVDVNPETGNITLKMDESFYFKNASFELREEAKEKIGKLIPVYAKSLLGTPKIADRIERIFVTGFASPQFNRSYVDPTQASGEPYEYNLNLSVNRAKEIVAYMFGEQIPAYEFKDRMRSMVSVSGMGFMGSIPLEKNSVCHTDPKALVKFEECICGPYDCKRSRRVEIEFVLKNQKDTERQLQKISDKLKDQGVNNVSH